MEKEIAEKRLLANDQTAHPDDLLSLEEETDIAIKILLSMNHNTPPELLDKLARENNDLMSRHIALNPSVSSKTLQYLFDHIDIELICRNLIAPASLMIRIWGAIKYKNDEITAAIIAHPNTPISLIYKILTSGWLFYYTENMKAFLEVIGFHPDNPNFTVDENIDLRSLKDEYFSKHVEYRVAVARQVQNTTLQLEAMSRDNDKKVRSAVAENTNTSPRVLRKLSKERIVMSVVAGNRNTPSEILIKLCTRKYLHSRIRAKNQHDFSYKLASDWKQVTRGLAQNVNLPLELYEVLVQEWNDQVIIQLMLNPNTPENILMEILSKIDEWADKNMYSGIWEKIHSYVDHALSKITNKKNLGLLRLTADERIQQAVSERIKELT